jgi:molybdopterin-binding protein
VTGRAARGRTPAGSAPAGPRAASGVVDGGAQAEFVTSLPHAPERDELRLAPGMLAVAAVKATNVVVELPR